MTPLLLIARNELRKGWLSLLLIGMIAGLTGAAVLGASSLARRAGTAEARLAEATNNDDVRVLVIGGDAASSQAIADDVLALPEVESGRVALGAVARVDVPAVVYVSVMEGPDDWGSDLLSPVLSSGRLPDPARLDEVVVNEAALIDGPISIDLGATFTIHFLAADEFARFDATTPLEGTAGTQQVTVVGLVRWLGSGDDLPRIVGTPALAEAYPEGMGVLGAVLVRLAPGASAESFSAAVNAIEAPATRPGVLAEFPAATVASTADQVRTATRSSTRVLTTGLVLMAIVAGVAGIAAVTQTATRHYGAGADEQRTELAIGSSVAGRVGARLIAASPMAIAAGLLAVLGGLLVASVSPPGALRLVEPRPGWAPNLAMIAIVAFATIVVMLAVLGWRAARVLRHARLARPWREAPLVARVARRGGRPPALLGLSLSLQPRPGPRGMSARTGIATVALCLAGVVATMTFAASLNRLVETPPRFGATTDLVIADVDRGLADSFVDDPRFSEVVLAGSTGVVIDGRSASAMSQTALTGEVEWEMARGRPPGTRDEIVLGMRLADELDKGPGDVVTLRDANGVEQSFVVVGTGVIPTFGSGEVGRNAALTPDGLERAAVEPPTGELGLVVASGQDAGAIMRELATRYEVMGVEVPRSVLNLKQIDRVPTILGVLLAVLAAVTVLHTSTMVARRGRPDLAITTVLGFTSRQTRTSLLVMSLLVTLVGVVIAVPLGLVTGSLVWRFVAEGAAVLGDAVWPWLGIGLLLVGAAIGATLVALALSARLRRRNLVTTLRTY